METRLLPTDTPERARTAVREAAGLLRAGEPVALPTETVYGLAADALAPDAVARVFAAKERPSFDPLIVHLPDKAALDRVAAVPEAISPVVRRLVEEFWPGPLTLVLPKRDVVPDLVTSGLPTVAVRMSAHPVFRKVIREFGGPLAAPSANRFGRISPTSAAAVLAELDGRIPLVIDGGACSWGLESTIIRVEPDAGGKGAGKPRIVVLRPGPVTREDLKRFGSVALDARAPSEGVEAPGQMESHYAPRTPLRLLASPDEFVAEPGKRYALLSLSGSRDDGYLGLADFEQVAVLSPGSGKLPEAAVRLFFLLRQLDASGADEIIAEPVPERGLGIAIMDRLRRASHPR